MLLMRRSAVSADVAGVIHEKCVVMILGWHGGKIAAMVQSHGVEGGVRQSQGKRAVIVGNGKIIFIMRKVPLLTLEVWDKALQT